MVRVEVEAPGLLQWIFDQVDNFDNESVESFLNITDTHPLLYTPDFEQTDVNADTNDYNILMLFFPQLIEFLVSGLAMMSIGCFGVVSNMVSVIFFFRQRTQRTFHRLLLLLAVVDTVHLVTSILSFSIPILHTSFHKTSYKYTLPYTLPIAQVSYILLQEYDFLPGYPW